MTDTNTVSGAVSAAPKANGSIGSELTLVVILLTAWVLAWVANVRPLDNYSPGGRSLYLNNWFTAETLTPSLLIGILAIVLLPLRHRAPLVAMLGIGAAVLTLEWFYPFVVSFSVTLALKAAVLWVAWKLRRWGLVFIVVVPVVAAASIREFQVNQRFATLSLQAEGGFFSSSNVFSLSELLEEILFFAVVIITGLVMCRFAEQRTELEQRNRELVVERAKASEAAVLDERLRISRELHDVVAHHVTTMTVHAGASRQLIDSNPEAATDSLRLIESSGRAAVDELHQLLGFLRTSDTDDEDRSPTPSLRHLSTLRESIGSEIICEVNVDGELSAVPSAVDVSAYRIIQEALTNTMKHSSAKKVIVDVVVGEGELSLTVSDNGRSWQKLSAKRRPASVGHGLIGMKERAGLHGGEIEVGPKPSGGGWLVQVVLPFGGLT